MAAVVSRRAVGASSDTMDPIQRAPIRWRRLVLAGLAAALVASACVPAPAREPSGTGGDASPAQPTVAPPSTATGPTPIPSFIRPTPTPLPTFLVYEIQPGDTLTSIARAFGTTARSIGLWNRERLPSLDPLSDDYAPDRLALGWALLIIPGQIYDEESLPLAPSPSG